MDNFTTTGSNNGSAAHYENLAFNDAANAIFKFMWDEFCRYIELAKDRLDPSAEKGKAN